MVVGIWAGVAAVAATAGPPVGGLLVGIDWRWIFLINVPIGVATMIAGWRVLPEVRAVAGSRLPDWVSSALLLYFIGFAIFLLSVVLFLQGEWHYSAVKAGLAIAPGPGASAVFAINAGRIRARFGRVLPAVAGTLFMVVAAGYWMLFAGGTPDYPVTFLPGLFAGGISAGLTQAPLFAAASTLPPDHVWAAEAIAGLAACLAIAATAKGDRQPAGAGGPGAGSPS